MKRPHIVIHPLGLVVGAYLVLGLVYSTTVPLFEAPDEQLHFAYVQYVATGQGLPVQSLDHPTHLARQEGSQPPLYYLLAAGATFWIDTSDFPDIVWPNPHYGYNVPGIVNDNKNLFIHTARENFPYQGATLAIHIARLVSLILGALAVVFTYLLAAEVHPRRNLLALSAAALVAFVPQFLLVSGAVSNDSTIVAMCALSLWLMVRMLRRRPSAGKAAVLGAAIGLAALAKVSGVGLVFLAAAVLAFRLRQNRRLIVACLSTLLGMFLLVAGWWYWRNWALYGEPTGTEMMLRIFGARQTPLTGAQFIAQVGEVWETFWIGFGWGNIRAQPPVYSFLELAVVLAVCGVLVGLVRNRNRLLESAEKVIPFAILALWAALVSAEFLRWMLVTQAPHGRLLFPALPAVMTILAFGLTQLAPPQFKRLPAPSFSAALFGLAALSPTLMIAPAYSFPARLGAEEVKAIPHRVDITYEDKIRLLGIDISPISTAPGGAIQLVLYWQSLAPMDRDYSIGIHVLDRDQQVVGSRDSYPGHGMYPTTLWRVGEIIRDQYWVPIALGAPPGVAQVQVALYDRSDQTDLAAFDGQGQSITPIVDRFKVAGPNVPEVRAENATHFVFGNAISLTGYTLKSEDPMTLTLFWERLAVVPVDYTVFVHVLDSNGKIIAQQDGQPMNGENPTSLWSDREQVVDSHSIGLPTNAAQIEVGLYSADPLSRLQVVDGTGRSIGDRVLIPLPRP